MCVCFDCLCFKFIYFFWNFENVSLFFMFYFGIFEMSMLGLLMFWNQYVCFVFVGLFCLNWTFIFICVMFEFRTFDIFIFWNCEFLYMFCCMMSFNIFYKQQQHLNFEISMLGLLMFWNQYLCCLLLFWFVTIELLVLYVLCLSFEHLTFSIFEIQIF